MSVDGEELNFSSQATILEHELRSSDEIALSGVALLSFSAASQNARFGGFTPDNEVTISFPRSTYAVGATAPADISIAGSPNGKYTVSITDEDDDEVGNIELEIGGETGSNKGTVNITLPGEIGSVTYTATVTIGDEEVSDEATLNVEADKQWKAGDKISGGELVEPANGDIGPIYGPYYVDEGSSLVFEVAPGRDQDDWKLLSTGEEGEEADELTYTWNPGVHGEIVKKEEGDRRITWKALPLPPNAGSVGEVMTCIIDDKPKEIPETEGGERDDKEKKISIMVYSVRRMWDAGTPIGEGRDAQGNSFNDGFLTSPFDYSNPDVTVETLNVVGGAKVPFSISAASDWDRWSKFREVTPVEGHEPDIITDDDYRWSAEGGGEGGSGKFDKLIGEDENGNPLYSEPSGTITGREVRFLVPQGARMNAVFTVKCEVGNDHGKTVSKPDGGTRIDSDKLERTQTIKVVGSSVHLALYKQVEAPDGESVSYEAVSDTAGGTVYGALEVRAREGTRVKSSRALVRLEETEEVEGEAHDDEESHVDVEVKFNEAAGWQKRGQRGAWIEAPEAPTSAPAEGGHYRYLIPWNTASGKSGERLGNDGEMVSGALLGHNGSHEVSLVAVDGEADAQVKFTSANGGEFGAEAPEKVEVEVSNLVIKSVSTSNGTQDYFKWDPGSGEPSLAAPVVDFAVEDQSGPGAYRWTIYFAKTSDVHSTPTTDWTANARRVWGVSSIARSFSINLASLGVNGHLRMQPEDDPNTQVNESDVPFDERSPYTFDIRVVKFPSIQAIPSDPSSESGEIGRVQFKQPYSLWIPHQFQTLATPTTPSQTDSGHDIWFDDQPDGSSEIRAKYYLYPNPAVEEEHQGANSFKLTAMDPTFAERGSIDGPTNAGELHDDLLVGSILEDDVSGDWRVLFTAEDKAGAVQRRDHKNTRMIPVNQSKPEYKVGLTTVPGGHKYSGGLRPLGKDIPWGSDGQAGQPKFKPAPGAPAGSPSSIEGMEFYVQIEGTIKLPSVLSAPNSMPFIIERIKEAANGGLSKQGNAATITGHLIPGVGAGTPTKRYTYTTNVSNSDQWVITRKAGRWDIGVGTPAGFSGTFRRAYGYAFKIDKREQIVQFAKKWDGRYQHYYDVPANQGGPKPANYHNGDSCEELARYIYNYVGLPVGLEGNTADLFALTSPKVDTGLGALTFYSLQASPTKSMDHVGVHLGPNSMLDQNVGRDAQDPDHPRIRIHDETDKIYSKYVTGPVHRTIPQLQDLDSQ